MCQKKLIHEKDWDILVILDACRYDFFERVYGDYFCGDLRSVESSGTCTSEWLVSTFDSRFLDAVYCSGNPYINSFDLRSGFFDAENHFFDVVDVWDSAWDDEKATVLPENMNECVFDCRERYPEKKVIAHYMQPHVPYLNFEDWKWDSFGVEAGGEDQEDDGFQGLRTKLGNVLESVLGRRITGELRQKIFGVNVLEEEIAEAVGGEKVRKSYLYNLRTVLEKVSELVDRTEGKIIVTSDHGELLGENGHYGHRKWFGKTEILKTVPWLEVKNNIQ